MVEPAGPILAALLDFFAADNWPFEQSAEQPVLRLPFQGAAGNWQCFAQAREEEAQFVFYSVYPVLVPEARRAAMAELLTRANYGLVLGNFELDYSDGEVRFETSLDVEGSLLTAALIQASVYANVIMMDQYMPAIVALLADGLEPQAALAVVAGGRPLLAVAGPADPRLIYTPGYDLALLGLERLHPFDGRRATRAWQAARRKLGPALEQRTLRPTEPITREQLLAVHTPAYLEALRSARYLAQVLELPALAWLPGFVLDRRLLRPMRLGTRGTLLAAEAALRGGLACNLAGGYHHASRDRGEGFCCYADLNVALAALRQAGQLAASDRVLVLDLDAHQGNGHERLAQGDPALFIVDVYNAAVFPGDREASRRIDLDRPLPPGTEDVAYLRLLRALLPEALAAGPFRLAFYIAGTDVVAEDPLGGLAISGDALRTRDRLVLTALRGASIPVAMLAGGGYGRHSYLHLADSIELVMGM